MRAGYEVDVDPESKNVTQDFSVLFYAPAECKRLVTLLPRELMPASAVQGWGIPNTRRVTGAVPISESEYRFQEQVGIRSLQ